MTINNRRPCKPQTFAELPMLGSQSTPEQDQQPFEEYNKNASAPRVYTDAVIAKSLRKQYPNHHLTITTSMSNLLGFAHAGHAKATIIGEEVDSHLWRYFVVPARRSDEGGVVAERVVFAGYEYSWQGVDFIVYMADCSDGTMRMSLTYILTEKGKISKDGGDLKDCVIATDALIEAGTRWGIESHDEILIFDGGSWQKSKELYSSVQKSNWEDVILDEGKKNALISDVEGFFGSEADYKEFSVPWKRGVIFHGPPGNGKTISIKAMMHSLMQRTSPTVEVLYVKTLQSYQGTEYSVRQIFTKARAMAPCLLVFEDIDSLIDDRVRSYFLNEVDGLQSNHGILMIGSTNHLDRLDPGIAKRPSRFDRKYFFDVPNRDERVQYCQYWKHKLRNNKKVDFPESLCAKIADITDDFSFAYLKEAFVGALLVIVRGDYNGPVEEAMDLLRRLQDFKTTFGADPETDPERTLLWVAIKQQVKNLREELDTENLDLTANSKEN